MPDNIWLYGFDGFNGLKTVGFVVADTDTEAEYKIWQMYYDFGADEYDLDDLLEPYGELVRVQPGTLRRKYLEEGSEQ